MVKSCGNTQKKHFDATNKHKKYFEDYTKTIEAQDKIIVKYLPSKYYFDKM